MAIHVTQIGKHKFVCGLFWQSLSRPRELEKEARDLAKKIDADLMVLRMDHSTAQAGFGSTKEGLRRGVFSLGAIVSKTIAIEGAYYDGAQQPVHNYLAAFKLPDGLWAYFAVRDGNYLPNGDFAGTKEEVLERLYNDYGLGGWNVVMGEAELTAYGFHNFNAKTIQSLIPHKKDGSIRVHKWWGLKQLGKKSLPTPAIAAIVLSFLALAGALAYWKHYRHQREEMERERAIQEMRKKMFGNARQDLSHPWSSKPQPQALAKVCLSAFRYLAPGGWQLDWYDCTAERAMHSWLRANSTVAFLREQVPDAMLEPGGERAAYVQPLPPGQPHDEELPEQRAVVETLLSRLQLLGIVPKISKVVEPQPPGQNNAPVMPWQTFSISFPARGLNPVQAAALIAEPGVRIDKLTYRNGEWLIEGTIYAK